MLRFTPRQFAYAATGLMMACSAATAPAQITFGTTAPTPGHEDPRYGRQLPADEPRENPLLRTTFAGLVTGVGNGGVTVQMAPPRVPVAMEQTFHLTETTAVIVNGSRGQLSQIREGDLVRVTTYEDDPEAAMKIVAVRRPGTAPQSRPATPDGASREPRTADTPAADEDGLPTTRPGRTVRSSPGAAGAGALRTGAEGPLERPVATQTKDLARTPASGTTPIGPAPGGPSSGGGSFNIYPSGGSSSDSADSAASNPEKMKDRPAAGAEEDVPPVPQPPANLAGDAADPASDAANPPATPETPAQPKPPAGSEAARNAAAAGEPTPGGTFGLGMKVFDSPGQGVLVTGVTPDGPAAGAGVLVGDFVMAMNGQPVTDPAAVNQMLSEMDEAATVPLELWRDGETMETKIRPATHSRATNSRSGSLRPSLLSRQESMPSALLGVQARNHENSGVEVTSVDNSNSSGLQPGDLILSVNGHPIDNYTDLEQEVRMLPAGERDVKMVARRGSEYIDISAPAIPIE